MQHNINKCQNDKTTNVCVAYRITDILSRYTTQHLFLRLSDKEGSLQHSQFNDTNAIFY